MDTLWVRTYNVRFGDAFLISIPDRDDAGSPRRRHILIDLGNAQAGEGGYDGVFRPVLEDIQSVLDGQPLDLYVMTHEHMDHVQGLLHASRLGLELDVDYAWLTASAAEDYYDTHSEAKKKFDLTGRFYDSISRQLAAAPESVRQPLAVQLANNNPRKTKDCVDYIRSLASIENTHYVHRGYPLEEAHPFRDVSFEIWAPEEDTSSYYGRFQPMAFGFMEPAEGEASRPSHARPAPPPGVDVSAFYNLMERRENGVFDNLLAIDKARNNTSVVLMLEWKGWRLLFSGDAEVRSWRTMKKQKVLKPVDFLKVSHHGSHNGTPAADILNEILPLPAPGDWERHAVVSTCKDAYNGVPHAPTLDGIKQRCEVHSTEGMADGEYFDIEFYPG